MKKVRTFSVAMLIAFTMMLVYTSVKADEIPKKPRRVCMFNGGDCLTTTGVIVCLCEDAS